jgi:predicted nucleic acid-binding protein
VSVADELLGFFSAGQALRAGVGFREVPRVGGKGKPCATGSFTRDETRTVFRRREAEGVLPIGEAAALYDELTADIEAADIVIQPETSDTERQFGVVLEACFSQTPPIFIRTNDALHLASAKVAGEPEFITADMRQRVAAMLMGFTVLP